MITFSYDVASPYAWLAAERVDALFRGTPVHWEPILLGAVFKAMDRTSWGFAEDTRAEGIAEVERRARERGLPDPKWGEDWPGNSLPAMRAATWATQLGPQQGRHFAKAAFALHFVEGVGTHHPDFVHHAAERAELDAEAAVAATQDPTIKAALRTTTDQAIAAGVVGVPCVRKDGEVLFGDDQLEDAAARWTGGMSSLSAGPQS